MKLSDLKKSFRGEEKLYIVFWFYYIIGSIVLGLAFGTIGALFSILEYEFLIWLVLLLFILPYVIWVSVSVWRCAFNTNKRIWGYLARLIIIGNIAFSSIQIIFN